MLSPASTTSLCLRNKSCVLRANTFREQTQQSAINCPKPLPCICKYLLTGSWFLVNQTRQSKHLLTVLAMTKLKVSLSLALNEISPGNTAFLIGWEQQGGGKILISSDLLFWFYINYCRSWWTFPWRGATLHRTETQPGLTRLQFLLSARIIYLNPTHTYSATTHWT